MGDRFPYIDERSIDGMSEKQLRDELKFELNKNFALMEAFRNLPEIANPTALWHLSDFADHQRDWERGKMMQRDASLEEIPPNVEYEVGAGLWSIIREALINANVK